MGTPTPHGYRLNEEMERSGRTVLYRGRRTDGAHVLARASAAEPPRARDLAALRHEHAILQHLDVDEVVRAIGLEERGAGLLLVMEDPGGQTLRALTQGSRLELVTALRIAAAAAAALDAIHRRGVTHKDIRPDNLLVDPDGLKVRLLGFGKATRLSHESPRITGPEALAATLPYISPEQTGRMNRPLDLRTDLYSLGVTLYEMLTGSLPFRDTDPMTLVHCHLAVAPAPPRERAPELPAVVSDIVMKLLAKPAEDRYQHAAGLLADVRRCLEQAEAGGEITSFPLGQRDGGGTLRIPQKLYGRDRERAALIEAWQRACQTDAELVLVSGYSGIGKSVLVHGIQQEIASARGWFISGKFDQLRRGVPYASIAEAFQKLIHQILTERDEALADWKAQILAAVGANGRLLTDLLPDLRMLLGDPPAVPDLPAAAAQARLAAVFERFVRVFATAERPLVLFLDDLQWADVGSLALIKALMTAQATAHLLMIGAYRSNEVDAGHLLHRALREIEASVRITKIELGPLDREDVGRFVAHALDMSPARVAPLSTLLYDKTQGNPFFLLQFLTAIHKDGLLTYDAAEGAFRWELAALRGRMATDNVVAFLVDRLRRLAPGTIDALKLAACIGHKFRLRMLATISRASPEAAAAHLWEALDQGVVVPLSDEYRFVTEAAGPLSPEIDVPYAFSHDRVQQAAYALIEEGKRAAVHLEIGRLLLADRGGDPDEGLFEIAGHLNIGAPLIDDPNEQLRLAEIDLAAGRKAKDAAAYAAAASFLAAGAAALGASGWDRARDLTFALHQERSECEISAGAFDEALALQDVLLQRSVTALERAQVLDLRVVLRAAQGRSAEAIEAGLEALRLLDIEVHASEDAWEAAARAELEAIPENLAGRAIDDVIQAPPLTDPTKRAVLTLLMHLTGPAFGLRPSLSSWITLKPVNLSLKYGNAKESPSAYALHGANLVNNLSRPEEGYAFARLGAALHEKIGGAVGAGTVLYFLATSSHHTVHWRQTIDHFERAFTACMESGDFLYACFAASHKTLGRLALGDPLPALRDDVEQLIAFTRRVKVASSNAILTAARQMIDSLLGRTQDRGTLSGDGFDEPAFARMLEDKGFKLPTSWYCTVKGQLAFLYGEDEAAARMLTRAWELGSLNFTTEICFYGSLAILSAAPRLPEAERTRLAAILTQMTDKLATSARQCPQNYLQKHLLVQAERARASGEAMEAIALYDKALAAAREHGWRRDVALASELCASFYLSAGGTRSARAHMADAVHAYAQWGASAKIAQLAERYPSLTSSAPPLSGRALDPSGSGIGPDWLDLTAFIRALQALSGELTRERSDGQSVLDNVFDRLMRLVLQSAGAERAFLLLNRDGALFIEAAAQAQPYSVTVRLAKPLDEDAELAVSVVRYVERRQDTLVLRDASNDNRFGGDPYVASRRPRSIACLALTHQGRSQGVLYLENDVAVDVFTKERVELLGLLLSQTAISVENARLYAQLQALTRDLETSNAELFESNERLSSELEERRRLDAQRASLQAEILQAQAERLAELSTPIIPIAKGILVVPIIGTVDAERARTMADVVSHGAHARDARVVIFDITGATSVDAGVIDAMRTTAATLRLLGAEAVITGVGARVAKTVVELGVDFGDAVTTSSLEAGIAHALARLGLRWTRARA